MPRSRPASDPISFHKPTGQYYVTRAGKRLYLGADRDAAMEKYHRLALGLATVESPHVSVLITTKELANRFIAAQKANWGPTGTTLRGYENWLGRFLADHPRLRAEDLTVEMFASWKLSLRRREYSPTSINHFLKAVRAMYVFAEETGLLENSPRLRRVKNERCPPVGSKEKPLYTKGELQKLIAGADDQLRVMLLLGLNCGFGPKDLEDLSSGDIDADRVTLPRSKTGVCQTFRLWPDTLQALNQLEEQRAVLIARMAKRGRHRSDGGHVFMTKYWRPWSKDAIAEQFRKLCKKVGVPCYGFYRLRHCASTAMSLVATPHVHRKFMRHSQLQQQVTYTHTPDAEVDAAVKKAQAKLIGSPSEASGSDQERAEVA